MANGSLSKELWIASQKLIPGGVNSPVRSFSGVDGEPLFIEFGDLPRMLVGLRRLLPTGTRLTYNYDYERAWVRSSAEVDLPSFAERARTLVWED